MRRILRWAGAAARNRTGGVPRPSWCTYLVTYRCNARCGMCDSWRMKPGSELTPGEVRRIFGQLHGLDVVRLSGGEPFLREDFAELVAAIAETARPAVLHITTNGSFPDRAEALARRFPRLWFLVSFDGLADEHDRNRGADVTFERALETVARLRALGVRVGANHTVISPRSLADAPGLRARLAPLGVDVQTVLAYEASAMYAIKLRGKKAEHLISARGYPLHPQLAGADVTGFIAAELRAAEALPPVLRTGKRYYLRGLLQRLRGGASYQPRCVAVRSHLRLLPDGSVPVCQFNTETIGSLRDQPFEAVWRGRPAAEARRWVDACAGCWAECEVIPSAIYTGDILRAAV